VERLVNKLLRKAAVLGADAVELVRQALERRVA
jgi:hypothetical protein